MLKGILPIGAACICCAVVHAQVNFTGIYAEDFDGLGATPGIYPSGWSGVRAGGTGAPSAALAPSVTTGTATSGGIYNVGLAGDSDRGLGSLSSSATIPSFGLQLLNTTGTTVDQLSLSGVMEQWRSGSSSAVDERLTFEYSLNAADLQDPGAQWLPLPAFDLPERLTLSSSAAAVDGSLAENQLQLSAGISGLGWQDNTLLTFRWTDADDAGSDGLYALDNLRLEASISPVPEPSVVGTFALGLGLVGMVRRWRRAV